MTEKRFWKHYCLGKALNLSIHFGCNTHQLERLLEPFRISQPDPFQNQIIFHALRSQLPLKGEVSSGRYKGIQWQASVEDRGGAGRSVYFASDCFTSFLAQRIIIIPWLKEVMLDSGGYELPGSAFEYKNKLFILFGGPGTGKTRSLFQAVDKGAEMVGDDELIISKDRQVMSLFGDLELRYQTIINTHRWKSLPVYSKIKLMIYRLMAIVSAGKISFNLVLNPKEIGMSVRPSLTSQAIWIMMGSYPEMKRISADEAAQVFINYEKEYLKAFASLFESSHDSATKQSRLENFFAGSSAWLVPVGTGIDQILQLQ